MAVAIRARRTVLQPRSVEEPHLCQTLAIFNPCNLEARSQQQCAIPPSCFTRRPLRRTEDVQHTKLVPLCNKPRQIRLVWVTVVALQILLYLHEMSHENLFAHDTSHEKIFAHDTSHEKIFAREHERITCNGGGSF